MMMEGPEKLRRLTCSDIPRAMELKEAAGWNQTEEDWRIFLDLVPEGCFALEKDGKVIATSTAVPYDRGFGWIGMMLVQPEERRKGYGTRMLDAAVSFLEARGLAPGLDATPLGKLLYDRHGFRALCSVERYVGTAPRGRSRHPACSTIEAGGLGGILQADMEAFGADRARLLRAFLGREGALGFVARTGGLADGYLLARPGSWFTYIGPWVARSPEAAAALWDTVLSVLPGATVGVDILVPNAPARALAAAAGLPVSRTLVRMARFAGEVAEAPQRLLTAAVLKGLLSTVEAAPVNEVSAPGIARDRGITVLEERAAGHQDYASLVTVAVGAAGGEAAVAGTVFGHRDARIVRVNQFHLEAVPDGHIILCVNDDSPGVVGNIGTALGSAGVNIAGISLSRDVAGAAAASLINVDSDPQPAVLDTLRALPHVRDVRSIRL